MRERKRDRERAREREREREEREWLNIRRGYFQSKHIIFYY